jgi:hypothetical protein
MPGQRLGSGLKVGTTLALVAALAAAVAAGAAVWAVVAESKRSRLALTVDLAMRLTDSFNSPLMLQRRRAAATALSAGDTTDHNIDHVLDFFESVGMLLRRGALDVEVVWSEFEVWIDGYFNAASGRIAGKRARYPAVWHNLVLLHQRVTEFDPGGLDEDDPEPPDEALRRFLKGEASLRLAGD